MQARAVPARAPGLGFTLVECAVVCAIAAILATMALPSLRGHELRAARLDGVQALTRLQLAQDQHRSLHGLYATELAPLKGVAALTLQGRYAIALRSTGPDGYIATAQALGVQLQDRDCTALSLQVRDGWAQIGPSALCWNR